MKQLKVLLKLQEIRLLVCFISCFTVSVTVSINALEPSNDFMILIFMIAFEIELRTNPGKLCLTKGIAMFAIALFPKLPSQEPNDYYYYYYYYYYYCYYLFSIFFMSYLFLLQTVNCLISYLLA